MRLRINLASSFKCKPLLKPCKKIILQLFQFKLRRPVSIKSLQFRDRKRHHTINKTKQHQGCLYLSKIMSVLHSLRPQKRQTDRVKKLTPSYSDAALQHRAPHPSPLTPAYIRMMSAANNNNNTQSEVDASDQDDVEDACRSFENYLTNMIVEDQGKMGDLVDVEEVMHCWKNLRSPVFIDLVCRFYAELCKDLFSNRCENYGVEMKHLRDF